jgi:putative ABC transport system substrate-binding protein
MRASISAQWLGSAVQPRAISRSPFGRKVLVLAIAKSMFSAVSNATTRVHHATRRRERVAACGARAAARPEAGADRLAVSSIARDGWALAGGLEGRPRNTGLEGRNAVRRRGAVGGRSSCRLQLLAEELAATKPKIVVAFPALPVRAVAKAAPDTPIVFAATTDPVAAGLAKSLAHPGGMITGISNVAQDITPKHLELLIAVLPELRRVGFLADSTNPARGQLHEAADRSVAQYKVKEIYEEVARPAEIDAAISRLADGGAQALVVIASPILVLERQRILRLAAARRWPVIGWSREWPLDGALMSYGVNVSDSLRRAAVYVDKILKGANPSDLPVEQPSKIELIINLKTAKALGLDVPLHWQQLADELIE